MKGCLTLAQFRMDESTQPLRTIPITKETQEERFKRLKATADATGRRFVQVYLEDEKKRGRDQR